jgi:hypothetical protein
MATFSGLQKFFSEIRVAKVKIQIDVQNTYKQLYSVADPKLFVSDPDPDLA